MQLSIIIVNYNVRPFLENCLSSLRKALEGISGEIFVVDNASDDGSARMVQSKFPEVRLIVNGKNLGFAAANNIALRQAQGTYILLINPDTIVQEDTLRTMVGFFDQNPDAALAGCKILNPDGSLQPACRRSFPTPWVAFTKISGLSALFPHTRMFGRYNLTYRSPEETYEVDAVSGSFMFLRHSVYEKIGGLDEQFFMYGEDLDWCYRMQQAGWKIYYVHSTKIIHYKGESAKRSDIDELKLFYEAMHVFVRKHFNKPSLAHLTLRTAIVIRSWLAVFVKAFRPLPMVMADWLFVIASLAAAEFLRFGEFFRLPPHAYPVLFTIPPVIVVCAMYALGLYTRHRLAIRRAAAAVIVGYVLISALTFFFKEYGFSRIVVAYSGIISLALLPGWRLLARAGSRSPGSRKSLLGRRTLIVGTEQSGHEVLRRLRRRLDNGYSVVGFIDISKSRIGEKIGGVEILGSIDNIGKVIREHKVTEVIFSTDTLSYMDILSVIGKSRERTVNFRLVPSSLEVIIGKTSIDQLDDIPLVDIDYNIDRTMNKISKRLFDLAIGVLLFPAFLYSRLRGRQATQRSGAFIRLIPDVLRGEYSLVGPPIADAPDASHNGAAVYLGKPGLTGLVQINVNEELTPEEVEKYNLYYARNQSFVLDVEILFRSSLQMLKKR